MKILILPCLLLAIVIPNSFGQSTSTLKLPFKEAPFESGSDKVYDITPTDVGGLTIEIDSIDPQKISTNDSWKFIKEDNTELTPNVPAEITDQKRVYSFSGLNSSLEDGPIVLRVKGKFADKDDTLLFSLKVLKAPDNSSEDGEPTNESSKVKISPEVYLSKIRELHPLFELDKVYREENTVYLFLDEELERIPGTEFPDCIEKNTTYLIQYFSRKDSLKLIFRGVERKGSDIVIRGASSQGLSDETQLFPYTSQPLGTFEEGADFFVQVATGQVKNFSFNSCSALYHVSISAGFFGSSLNNPENITQNGANGTLYADNQTTQKALTIMALFYPIPRDPYYKYKELDFWQKWSFSFGTKLSENIFDDLLLGLNFEFSKGGNFSGGIHYGQHTVIRGYKKFQFGKDTFKDTFDNSQTNLRWDVGFFLGVTLDLRIVNALRSNGRDQRRRNEEDANKTKQPTP